MSFNLFVVRHGQTIFNKYNRMQGWSDAPLTEKGIADGQAAGNRLANVKFDHVFSSDLTRAVRTARFIMNRNNATPDYAEPTELAQFREEFFGTFEGLPGPTAAQAVAELKGLKDISAYGDLMAEMSQDEVMNAIHAADPTHDAENAEQFWTRVEAGLDILKTTAKDGENVLLVVHGTLIRNLAGKYAGPEYTLPSMHNGSISKWVVDQDKMTLEVFNDIEKVW
ncbi:histidine phosphatase family protein [Weissella diestrammenae]|uniref:Histidine phosphatase family protein n=1 Tax=Weissella diestrammenae TaxID=1162633 RepID=A0A7G9T6I2_9LACO|nr:histidine phosphatase family protein [Weissella diestrammenae]MCM0583238.1 histidine phosphatase family protein [Weissella diestrammenae]QNN75707.1 histidine phosphatase family protein [Weissella diestrammenae]